MARLKVKANPSIEEAILRVAKTEFAAKGFDGTSVKDICDAAGVNVGAISYYFGGKEGLYRSCLEGFGRYRLKSTERILQTPKSIEDVRVRLSLFLEEFIELHFLEPEVSQILHKECTSERAVNRKLFREVFLPTFGHLHRFFKEGIRARLLKRHLDPLVMSAMLFGGIIHVLRTDTIAREYFKVSLKDKNHRKHFVKQAIDQFLMGASSK